MTPGYPHKVMGPDPEMPNWPTYPWMAGATSGSISVLVGPQGAGAGFSRNITTGTSHSVDGGFDIGKGPVNAHFGGGYDWSAGQETSANLVLADALPPGKETWIVWRQDVKRDKGHLDVYGTHGMSGRGVWRKDDAVGVDYSYYQPYADTTQSAFDPPPGWNPPGYNP